MKLKIEMIKLLWVLIFFYTAYSAPAQSILVQDPENNIVDKINVGDKIYIEFTDSLSYAENQKIVLYQYGLQLLLP